MTPERFERVVLDLREIIGGNVLVKGASQRMSVAHRECHQVAELYAYAKFLRDLGNLDATQCPSAREFDAEVLGRFDALVQRVRDSGELGDKREPAK